MTLTKIRVKRIKPWKQEWQGHALRVSNESRSDGLQIVYTTIKELKIFSKLLVFFSISRRISTGVSEPGKSR